MALLYVANLIVTDHEGKPATLQRVAAAVGRWAGVEDPWREQDVMGRRDAAVRTELVDLGSDATAWRLSLTHPDQEDAALDWSVSVVAVANSTTEVSVRLERTRRDTALLLPKARPAPPGCIAAILDAEALRVVDAGRPLGTDVSVARENDAEELAALVMSPVRRLPVIAFTPRDDDVVDGAVLLKRVLGIAHVVLVLSETTWRLNGLLPPGFNVYGGAARVWWPGITTASDRWKHKLWTGDVWSHRIVDEAASMAVDAALASPSVEQRVSGPELLRRDRALEALRSELDELKVEYDAAPYRNTAEGGMAAEPLGRLREAEVRLLDTLASERANYAEMAELYEAELGDARREIDELRRRAGSAEVALDYYRAESDRLRKALAAGGVPADDASAIVVEITREVESKGDVDGARPRRFTVGSTFLETLEAHGPSIRPKALRACATVVLGAPGPLSKTDDHPLRSGEGADDPPRLRSRDGAEGRRCSVEQNAPAARRLHYWLLGDGSIEFASVNVHDDMTIPE